VSSLPFVVEFGFRSGMHP